MVADIFTPLAPPPPPPPPPAPSKSFLRGPIKLFKLKRKGNALMRHFTKMNLSTLN